MINELLECGDQIPVVNKIVPYAIKAAPIVKRDVIQEALAVL